MIAVNLGGKPALFPGSHALNIEVVQVWKAWYLFSCDHDIIEIGPEFVEQKGKLGFHTEGGAPWNSPPPPPRN